MRAHRRFEWCFIQRRGFRKAPGVTHELHRWTSPPDPDSRLLPDLRGGRRRPPPDHLDGDHPGHCSPCQPHVRGVDPPPDHRDDGDRGDHDPDGLLPRLDRPRSDPPAPSGRRLWSDQDREPRDEAGRGRGRADHQRHPRDQRGGEWSQRRRERDLHRPASRGEGRPRWSGEEVGSLRSRDQFGSDGARQRGRRQRGGAKGRREGLPIGGLPRLEAARDGSRRASAACHDRPFRPRDEAGRGRDSRGDRRRPRPGRRDARRPPPARR